jgi:DNA primase
VAEVCVLDVAGREIAVTNPDRVFFSERGETKLDVMRYYLAVSEPLLARGRRAADSDAAVPERR